MFLLIVLVSKKSFATLHFNTSHVSINRLVVIILLMVLSHFNTSHVSINLSLLVLVSRISQISIHLMFLLIANSDSNLSTQLHFNTSHVSINRKTALLQLQSDIFQYISCFY